MILHTIREKYKIENVRSPEAQIVGENPITNLVASPNKTMSTANNPLSFLSKVEVNDVQLIEMKQGKELAITDAFSHTVVHQLYRAYGPQGFIGIMRRTPQSMKVEKNIFI